MHIVSVNMYSSGSTGKKDASLSLQHIRSYTTCELQSQNIKTPPQPTNIRSGKITSKNLVPWLKLHPFNAPYSFQLQLKIIWAC